MAKKKKAETKSQPEFAEVLTRLETIVQSLETGELTLEQALELYEEGVGCLKDCQQRLDSAERKIEMLTGVDSDGNAETELLDDEEFALTEKAGRRSARRSKNE
ncbi:MAG: exodeoxyribonuclease VII small subunit [bacterium]|nr:exodeoxyribonuclease VII small subunit [bacterium]